MLWVLMGGNSAYALGNFDGTTFTPKISRLNGQRGRGFFAAQTFSDEPHGRRIEIGWLHTHTNATMPFNQSMSIPMELKLETTTEGVRLTRTPVKELESLRTKSHRINAFSLGEGSPNILAEIQAELLEIRIEFQPIGAHEIRLRIRGITAVYDVDRQELKIGDLRASSLLADGRQRLVIYVDRTGLEIFACKGEVFVPFPINLDPGDLTLELETAGGAAIVESLVVHELKSSWE